LPTSPATIALIAACVLCAALLYSSGGHAGATAYLAIMALFSFAPAVMRPTALVMNIAVATIGSTRFIRARAVPWNLLRPLCAGSIPAAFLGGRIKLTPHAYVLILGAVLLVAAVFLWMRPRITTRRAPPPAWWLVAIGATLGFVAGLTGIGGGIFLSPLLILTGWEEPRRTSGAAAVFILVNSILGLLGQLASLHNVPLQAAAFGATAIVGGLVGSYLGVHRLQLFTLRRVHAVVLLVSGAKLLIEGLR
jgi:uncharacterized protein